MRKFLYFILIPGQKKKHYKRRLISDVFLKKINKILKINGIVFVTTDSEDYLNVILNEFLINKNFLLVNKKITNCYKRSKELIETKYEKKANIKNNKKYFLKFKKMC